MNTLVLFFVVSIAILPVSLEAWSLVPRMENIFNKSSQFVKEKSDEMKNFVTTSLDYSENVKDTFNDYFKDQLKNMDIVKEEFNSYMESFKQSSLKVTDSWPLVHDEDHMQLENPDAVLTVPAVITKNGYDSETHTVISRGYVLNLHRIAHSRSSSAVPKKTVLLHHGLLASSADWILNGPGKGLAYVLADAGYDVWMANIRGNRYSREHEWLRNDSKSYWNFSWHDVALYDVPAIIDYILKLKGSDCTMTYIGHSMGTTILFAMLTLRPEYNTKLTAGFALAPVVFLSDLKSPLRTLAPYASNLATLDTLQGSYEFIPKTTNMGSLTSACSQRNVDTPICKNFAFYICGYNEKQFNKTLMPVFLAHLGTGTSWKTVLHFSQEIVSGDRFQQFDYGYYDNFEIYGTLNPPEYDLIKVTLPIKLFWSKNDLLSSETDVKLLYDRLPQKPDMYLVPDTEFNHLDYLWAVDAPRLLNDEVVISLEKAMRK